MTNLRAWIAARLARDAAKWHHLWSVQGQLLVAALDGLYAAWPAFQDTIPAPAFASMSVFMSIALVALRLTKQKDIDA